MKHLLHLIVWGSGILQSAKERSNHIAGLWVQTRNYGKREDFVNVIRKLRILSLSFMETSSIRRRTFRTHTDLLLAFCSCRPTAEWDILAVKASVKKDISVVCTINICIHLEEKHTRNEIGIRMLPTRLCKRWTGTSFCLWIVYQAEKILITFQLSEN